jgi:UDP-galactopyranose mutase
MDVITRHEGEGRLILIEVPITSQIHEQAFPANVMANALAKNLYARRAYPQQSAPARERYEELRKQSERSFPNLLHCGRHAEFRYIGMPETFDSAWRLVEERF